MAFNPSPQVAEARNFARKFKKRRVIILSLDEEILSFASYGETPEECRSARKIADVAYEAVMDALERGIDTE